MILFSSNLQATTNSTRQIISSTINDIVQHDPDLTDFYFNIYGEYDIEANEDLNYQVIHVDDTYIVSLINIKIVED